MIDLTKPVRLWDDRSKIDGIPVVSEVLWQDGKHALVRVKVDGEVSGDFALDNDPDEPFLIDLARGTVLNEDWGSWVIIDS